ncbi:Aste57867_10859 [Aphanomyces stellatus]|uniref:Aste57867_10859 protein n=1 Tax=Aphanomyces stellatus TaxID=120398 RepID=A0A485KRF2_9STRA|nr:hypothetical protein As57867_010819 [Aphanomyces stellatus]VFT87727.1 Aste57867_10859 [Aphanomyces stellatus]
MPSKIVLVAALAASVAALPQYVANVPNGANVQGVAALGHVDTSGGGARNAFGQAFGSNNHKWTAALCQADSDGDGATNGEELGDPCCSWKIGATLSSTTATHPGVPNKFTPDQLLALKCQTSGNTTAAPSTGSTPAPAATTAKGSASAVGVAAVALALAIAAAL